MDLRGPLHEGRGLTHALTDTAPTDLAPSGGARASLVETGESEDVRTRVGLHCDSAEAFAELRYGAVVHSRENSVKYGHTLGQTLYLHRRKEDGGAINIRRKPICKINSLTSGKKTCSVSVYGRYYVLHSRTTCVYYSSFSVTETQAACLLGAHPFDFRRCLVSPHPLFVRSFVRSPCRGREGRFWRGPPN